MRRDSEAGLQSVAPFVPILADEKAPFGPSGGASLLGSVPEYLGRVLCSVDEQIWFEEVVESSCFKHPSHVFFGFLAHI